MIAVKKPVLEFSKALPELFPAEWGRPNGRLSRIVARKGREIAFRNPSTARAETGTSQAEVFVWNCVECNSTYTWDNASWVPWKRVAASG